MKLVYMGTPNFAVASLDKLHKSHHQVVGVITTPDRRGGRGRKKIIESDVKKYAVQNDIPVLQPNNLKQADFIQELKNLDAEIFAVVAFRMLPEVVWNMPKLGTINLHGSLLPQFRGAAPIHRAIMDGAETTGVTTFRLKHKIDTGNILLQKEIKIGPNETTGELHDRMKLIGADLLLETFNKIEDGSLKEKAQDESKVSHAPKIFYDDCEIKFQRSYQEIHNFIRGLDPYPGAWTKINDETFKLFSSKMSPDKKLKIGTIVENENQLYFQCKDGGISVTQIQPFGKRKMTVKDFLNGNPNLASTVDGY